MDTKCPNCGKSITLEIKTSQNCPYCGVSIKVSSQDVSKYNRAVRKAKDEISKLEESLKNAGRKSRR